MPTVLLRAICCALLITAITGCGGSGNSAPRSPSGGGSGGTSGFPSSAASFVYAGNFSEHSIDGYRLDRTTGVLAALSNSPLLSGISRPWTVASDASGNFLFVSCEGDFMVPKTRNLRSYRIDRNSGNLSQINAIDTSPEQGVPFMRVHPSGRFLYVVDGQASIDVIGVGTGGDLSPPLRVSFPAWVVSAGYLAIDPSGRFLVAAVGRADLYDTRLALLVYSIDQSTGSLALLPNAYDENSQNPAGAGGMIFVGNRLFISTGLNPILTFQLGDDGALTLVNSLYTNVQNSGLLLATPDGKYLYLENESARSIWAYRIGSAGDLSYLYTLSIGAALGNSPGDMVMDRSGTHLYVTVQHEGIYGFSIDAAGGLVALSGSPFAVVNPTVASLALVE